MARNMPEPPPRLRQSVYWRRRAAVLTLGTGLVSLLVWSVTGVVGGAGHANGAARPGAPATARPAAATGGATPEGTRSPAPGSRPTAPRARTPSQAAARPSAGRSGTPGSGAAAAAGQQAHPPAGLPPACAPRNVVLSLVTSQGSYSPAVQPQFQVFVVSVGARDCSFNIGPAGLSVLIKAGGTGLVWDSADCAQAAGSHFVQLSRGVPRALYFRWDRQASSPSCQQAGRHARPGTYTATAVAPAVHLASQGMVFVLTGPGVGMP